MGNKKVTLKVLKTPKFLTVVVSIFLAGAVFGATSYYLVGELFATSQRLHLENAREKLANIVAVKPDKSGTMLTLGVTISHGEGRILEDTHQLKGFDFQLSHHIAVGVASEFTNAPLDDDGVGIRGVDVLFEVFPTVEESVEISAIDGPSAGAAATLAVIAAIENSSLREDAAITGTIREDGTIGPVEGLYVIQDREGQLHVLGKAAAAHEAGINVLFVSKGQPVEVYEPFGWWWITSYKSVSFLRQVIEQKGWELEIQEVSNVNQASDLMLV